jgi:predicted nucleic acid-binding protein
VRSVTLDSNIFVSALVFGGELWRVLKSAEDGLIRLDVSETIFEEFGRVLREKFEWSTEDVAKVQGKDSAIRKSCHAYGGCACSAL